MWNKFNEINDFGLNSTKFKKIKSKFKETVKKLNSFSSFIET